MTQSAAFRLHDGFRAVVVGGAGGIGQPIAELFAELGASVVATAASDDEAAASKLHRIAGVEVEPLDITDDEAVDGFAARFDGLDALVNCAGILRRDEEYRREVFRRVLDINLTGTFSMCEALRPALATRQGAIVNIASMNAYTALPRLPAYCASKAGIVMLTKSLAHAWAGQGIRVNAVAPGFIETALNAEGRKEAAHYQRIAERTAFKRWGQPDEVAGAVVFLTMPEAGYVTGTVLAVDGGYLAG
ncbi:SDR family NAD(P)-dependent oxidoreductase [Pararhizobium mangrovi]|uniref:SDR family oxidoreductase n=1 Tax=Pararhizobium mangrovi TaxID=2590452 RepID=A0A506UBV6_9HYPH|nr:SDR family oxidoreductase [Pararhizobium mangrovi]TPW31892.1 SDR family oxidoreductase [Pararhizobium mangrovi]